MPVGIRLTLHPARAPGEGPKEWTADERLSRVANKRRAMATEILAKRRTAALVPSSTRPRSVYEYEEAKVR